MLFVTLWKGDDKISHHLSSSACGLKPQTTGDDSTLRAGDSAGTYKMFYKRRSLELTGILNKKAPGAFLFCLHTTVRAWNVCFLYRNKKLKSYLCAEPWICSPCGTKKRCWVHAKNVKKIVILFLLRCQRSTVVTLYSSMIWMISRFHTIKECGESDTVALEKHVEWPHLILILKRPKSQN